MPYEMRFNPQTYQEEMVYVPPPPPQTGMSSVPSYVSQMQGTGPFGYGEFDEFTGAAAMPSSIRNAQRNEQRLLNNKTERIQSFLRHISGELQRENIAPDSQEFVDRVQDLVQTYDLWEYLDNNPRSANYQKLSPNSTLFELAQRSASNIEIDPDEITRVAQFQSLAPETGMGSIPSEIAYMTGENQYQAPRQTPDFYGEQFEDFTGTGSEAGRSMEESYVPPPREYPSYVSEPDFYQYGEEYTPPPRIEREGVNRDIKTGTYPDTKALREYDPNFFGFINRYDKIFPVNSTYEGSWRPFEDILRDELGEEIPEAGFPGTNAKRNALLKLREWYNDRSKNQRIATEEEWEKAGLPVGKLINEKYEYSEDDWKNSDDFKQWQQENNPEGREIAPYSQMAKMQKEAFEQWQQNSINNRQKFYETGEVPPPVKIDKSTKVGEDVGEVVGEDVGEVIRPGDAKENYIRDFLTGQVPGYEWIADLDPSEMSVDAIREMAEGIWDNQLSADEKSIYGVEAPSPEVTTEGTGEQKILSDSAAKINAYKTLADYSGQSLPSIIKMSVDGTLPSIPPALLEELKRPLIRIQQAGEDAFGNPITIGVDIPNPNIEPLFNIYRTQLDTQVEAFRLAQQKDISAEDRDSRFNQALVSATGGLAGTGTGQDFGPTALAEQERRMARIAATGGLETLTPQQLQDFQQQQALIGATGGLSGTEGGLTPEALAQQELQRQQISATGGLSGLTPFSGAPSASEAARIQQQLFGADPARAISTARSLTPFEMAQLQLQPLRMQQAQEEARRAEEQRQFNEQLAINQRAQQLAELESQRRLGLQAGQLQQQRQLELARLFSDPTAVGSLSAIYGPQFFEQEQVFGSPFAGQTGAVQPLPVQNQQQPSFTPATNVSTPFGSSLTTGQFQEMSPYAQGQYLTSQARQKGKSRQELEREMEAVTPFGTPTGRGGLDKYFSGTGEL